jgi:hypothetical protein
MCAYGKHFQFRYGMYIAVNKNDDDLHIEIVELDWNLAHDLMNKAQDIIEAKFRPQRISDNPAYYECKYCAAREVCHQGLAPLRNCRTCKNSSIENEGKWSCDLTGKFLSEEDQLIGCEKYELMEGLKSV